MSFRGDFMNKGRQRRPSTWQLLLNRYRNWLVFGHFIILILWRCQMTMVYDRKPRFREIWNYETPSKGILFPGRSFIILLLYFMYTGISRVLVREVSQTILMIRVSFSTRQVKENLVSPMRCFRKRFSLTVYRQEFISTSTQSASDGMKMYPLNSGGTIVSRCFQMYYLAQSLLSYRSFFKEFCVRIIFKVVLVTFSIAQGEGN